MLRPLAQRVESRVTQPLVRSARPFKKVRPNLTLGSGRTGEDARASITVAHFIDKL